MIRHAPWGWKSHVSLQSIRSQLQTTCIQYSTNMYTHSSSLFSNKGQSDDKCEYNGPYYQHNKATAHLAPSTFLHINRVSDSWPSMSAVLLPGVYEPVQAACSLVAHQYVPLPHETQCCPPSPLVREPSDSDPWRSGWHHPLLSSNTTCIMKGARQRHALAYASCLQLVCYLRFSRWRLERL